MWLSPTALDLGAGVSVATESITTTSMAPERISMSVISSACSPVSGWLISSSSTSTPMARGVDRVHGVLGVDVGADATHALRLGHDVHGERGLAGALGAEDLGDAAVGQAADPEREVEAEGAGGHRLDRHRALLAHLHDGALAVRLLDAGQRQIQRLQLVLVLFHLALLCGPCCSTSRSGECQRPYEGGGTVDQALTPLSAMDGTPEAGCERHDCSYERSFDQAPVAERSKP